MSLCQLGFIADVTGDDAFDFFTDGGTSLLDQQPSQTQQSQSQLSSSSASTLAAAGDAAVKSDLSSLLSNKLQQDTTIDATRGLHFVGNDDYSAKRNLTLMLETKQTNQVVPSTDSNSSGVGLFDDAFNGGTFTNGSNEQDLFNGYPPKGDVTLASASLYGEGRKFVQQSVRSDRGVSVVPPPTPPGSQTQTPDLTQELGLVSDSMQQHMQQRLCATTQLYPPPGGNSAAATSTGASAIAALLNGPSSSLVDTPSSLDTLSGHDSRESLGDPFLHGFTDTVTDITADLPSGAQSMDISEPLDFTYSSVDAVMPQMVP